MQYVVMLKRPGVTKVSQDLVSKFGASMSDLLESCCNMSSRGRLERGKEQIVFEVTG